MPSVVADEDPETDGMTYDLPEDATPSELASSISSTHMSRPLARATQPSPMLKQRPKSAQRPMTRPMSGAKSAFTTPRSRSLTRPASTAMQNEVCCLSFPLVLFLLFHLLCFFPVKQT